MKKRIGIIFPLTLNGGVFQYALTVARCLLEYSHRFTYSIIHFAGEDPRPLLGKHYGEMPEVIIPQKTISLSRRIIHFLGLFLGIEPILISEIDAQLERAGIDLLIAPTPFSYEIPIKTPYLVFIPDLMHRYYPNFPEYRLLTRISRDVVYGYYAANAVTNIVESEQGADDLHKFFAINRAKIEVIPMIPPNYVYDYRQMDLEAATAIVKKYNLPEKFLFYPAQFWYHKNHLRLIQALAIIKRKFGTKISLVLVGNAGGHFQKNYQNVIAEIEKQQIKDQVIHLGYVSNQEIIALYKKSTALVFPSLIGPTSIPPLEAMVLGVPLACSHLFAAPQQIGEAGVLFNPFDVNEMAEKIYRLWQDDRLRAQLKKRGILRTAGLSPENYARQWEEVIEKSLAKLAS